MQPKTLKWLEDIHDAASFILIHGYQLIDDAEVWCVITHSLPALKYQVEKLLTE